MIASISLGAGSSSNNTLSKFEFINHVNSQDLTVKSLSNMSI
jgi:hypothetical protein